MRSIVALVLVTVLLAPAGPLLAQTTEADVYVAQAVLDFDEKRYDAALENLRQALELEPDHVEALYYTGVVHMARRRPTDAIPFLTRARKQSPTDPSIGFQLGLAYFAEQQYDQAEPLLEEVFRQNPTLDGLGYYVGFIRYRKKDYRGALDAFRGGRATDTDIQQLTRFYTGLALAVLGLPTQAAAEVEQALRLAPGSPLTGPAERLRDTIVASRAREHRFTAELRLGGFYDDNVAVIPGIDTREPLVRELRGADRDSTGELLGFRAEYSFLRDLLKRDDWDGTVGYSFFGTYNNDLPDFNVTNHLLSAGVTYRTAVGNMPVQTGLQYAWDVLYLDDDEFIQRNTVTVFGALLESEMHLTQVFARYQAKQFNTEPGTDRNELRDANNYMIGALHLLRFNQDAHFIKLGYQFDYEDTKGDNYRYRGHRFLAGGQYTLPWRAVRLKYDFDVHVRDYTVENTLLPTFAPGTRERRDEELTHIARAEIPLFDTCIRRDHCIGWTLSAEYQHTSAFSNLAVFDYSRNVFSVILSLVY